MESLSVTSEFFYLCDLRVQKIVTHGVLSFQESEDRGITT